MRRPAAGSARGTAVRTDVAAAVLDTRQIQRRAAQHRDRLRLTLAQVPRRQLAVVLVALRCMAEKNVPDFMKAGLVRQRVDRRDGDRAAARAAEDIPVGRVERDLGDVERLEGARGVPGRRLDGRHIRAVSLREDEPARTIGEAREHVGRVSAVVSLRGALDRHGLAERDRSLALADMSTHLLQLREGRQRAGLQSAREALRPRQQLVADAAGVKLLVCA